MRRPRDWGSNGKAAVIDPQDREDYPGKGLRFLIRSVHRAFARVIEAEISADTPITYAQWSFLRVLWREDGLSQRELSERLGLMANTTVISLNIMESRGWVKRQRDTNDRRRINIFLTREGRGLKRLLPAVRRINKLSVEGIPARDIVLMQATLEKMLDRLEAQLEQLSTKEKPSGLSPVVPAK
jgi:DNA-binding MarR family transcriptional regulator